MNTDRNHPIEYELLLAYVKGELSDEKSLEVEFHLLTHPEDQALVEGIIALRNRFSNDERELETYLSEQRESVKEFYPEDVENELELQVSGGATVPIRSRVAKRRNLPNQIHLPVPPKREPIYTKPIAVHTDKAKQIEEEFASSESSFSPFTEFNTMSELNTSENQVPETEPKTIRIPETNASMLTPLDENEFLHQVLSRRKSASRIQKGESGYEETMGLKTSLAFESFPIVKHTLERIEWLNARIGEKDVAGTPGKVREVLDQSLNGEGWLEKISPDSDSQEINRNFEGAEKFQSWKKELISKYVGDQKEQWVDFFNTDYTLQNELKDQEMYRSNSGKFFWNSLGLGLIFVFCSLYLWAMISAFSFTHLLLALGYVFILCIFPDKWMYQLFGNPSTQEDSAGTKEKSSYDAPISKSLFWVRALLTFFLSLSLIYVSEGLPVWTEYFTYFFEYSPYWLMIWAMSFALLHFLPAYRRKTSELYRNTITPYRRFKAYQRSTQHEKLMELVAQGDKWNKEMLDERERLRNERNNALFNGELIRRKRVFETQLERLGYLYDLGMGGEESTLNASFKRPRSRGKLSQESSYHND